MVSIEDLNREIATLNKTIEGLKAFKEQTIVEKKRYEAEKEYIVLQRLGDDVEQESIALSLVEAIDFKVRRRFSYPDRSYFIVRRVE